MNNKDLEQMILQELVLQPILEFIVDKFAEELLKEDEEGNGGFSNVDNLANQGQNTQQVSEAIPLAVTHARMAPK